MNSCNMWKNHKNNLKIKFFHQLFQFMSLIGMIKYYLCYFRHCVINESLTLISFDHSKKSYIKCNKAKHNLRIVKTKIELAAQKKTNHKNPDINVNE